jgi:hypothetical protein
MPGLQGNGTEESDMDATDEIEVNVNNGFCGDGYILSFSLLVSKRIFSYPLE